MRARRLLSLRRDLVIALALPVVGKLIAVTADQLRARRGPSQVADRLDQAGQLLRRLSRFV